MFNRGDVVKYTGATLAKPGWAGSEKVRYLILDEIFATEFKADTGRVVHTAIQMGNHALFEKADAPAVLYTRENDAGLTALAGELGIRVEPRR